MTVVLEGNAAAVLQRIVSCFRRERVPYVLIGAWALAVWGRPRATSDVDFLVFVNEKDLGRLSERMTQAGMALDETWLVVESLREEKRFLSIIRIFTSSRRKI